MFELRRGFPPSCNSLSPSLGRSSPGRVGGLSGSSLGRAGGQEGRGGEASREVRLSFGFASESESVFVKTHFLFGFASESESVFVKNVKTNTETAIWCPGEGRRGLVEGSPWEGRRGRREEGTEVPFSPLFL